MALPKNIPLRFLLATVVLVSLILILQIILPVVVHTKIWEIVGFMAITSFLISLLNAFLLKNFGENFFQIMVLAMILRFIASLVFIGLEVWPGIPNIILFIADFFIVFLFYLIFDIYAFLSNLRPISK
ncbi:hypothetical protein [Algoriphagus boritolerans]|uniref:ATP synthase I chain n=1 Tax=Algoriphagus boritolerans DSM 17298 = JCM 18970 TaxID=1120964 RepID=A0A1H5W0K5_9BACT|nr:hypothetical protein [Algoriphagus boritolerans]SEF93035.1 hypothetical protein SAMN03080598_01919 [Algoriphagus boritolerans DSM 17298 = JCM 18970]